MMEGIKDKQKQALRYAENLSLPKVQIIVMKANMGCTHCRQRVSSVVSKMNAGLLDYMVDMGKQEVTVRGFVSKKERKKPEKGAIIEFGRSKGATTSASGGSHY